MKKLRYVSSALGLLLSLSLLLTSCGKSTSASEPASAQEQEDVIDNTRANTEYFLSGCRRELWIKLRSGAGPA